MRTLCSSRLMSWVLSPNMSLSSLCKEFVDSDDALEVVQDAVSKEASLIALVAPVYAERNLKTVAALGSTLRLLKVCMLLHDSRQLIQTLHHLPHLQVLPPPPATHDNMAQTLE